MDHTLSQKGKNQKGETRKPRIIATTEESRLDGQGQGQEQVQVPRSLHVRGTRRTVEVV